MAECSFSHLLLWYVMTINLGDFCKLVAMYCTVVMTTTLKSTISICSRSAATLTTTTLSLLLAQLKKQLCPLLKLMQIGNNEAP